MAVPGGRGANDKCSGDQAVVVQENHFFDIVVYNQLLNACIYTLLYLAFLRLRATRPDLPRRFSVPGGWPGALLVCTGPFFVCWLGVPAAAREFAIAQGWKPIAIALAAIASGPAAWLLFRNVRLRPTPSRSTP